jgi:hypothetical protein
LLGLANTKEKQHPQQSGTAVRDYAVLGSRRIESGRNCGVIPLFADNSDPGLRRIVIAFKASLYHTKVFVDQWESDTSYTSG